MARLRTQKIISKRIDLNYFKGHHPLRTGRKALMWGFFVVSILAVTMLSMGGRAGRLHNPGPVASVHGMWENNCEVCHAGDGKGGFLQGVSDSACLKCHDAAVHSENQTRFIAMAGSAANGAGGEHGGAGNKAHMTASNCVACHTEHRGHDALLGIKNDQSCTTCHADLSKDFKATPAKAQPVVAARVTAFNTGDHPRFGRMLMKDGKLVDPTVLKYNHVRHNTVKGLEDNCTACHSTAAVPAVANEMGGDAPPPWVTNKDKAGGARATSPDHGGRDIQPISYERNCMGCHPINLPGGGPALSHDKLEVVRAQLMALPAAYAAQIASDPNKEKKLVTEEKVGRPPRQTIKKVVKTEDQYVEEQLKTLAAALDKGASAAPEYAAVKKVAGGPTTLPSLSGAVQGPNPNIAELFVVYGSSNACVKCHEVTGTVPAMVYGAGGAAVADAKPATTKPGGATAGATTKPTLLATVDTGVPVTPRRWFANSTFDHDAHRSVKCLDCHAKALESKDTADVLSPDIDTRPTYTLAGKQMTGQSCVDCHVPTTATGNHGATTHCVACHQFHDRTKERSPDGGMLVGMPPVSEKAVGTTATPEKAGEKADEKKGAG